jgi:hypothetical protein
MSCVACGLGWVLGFGSVEVMAQAVTIWPGRLAATPPAQATTSTPVLVTLAPDAGRLPADKRYMPMSINEPLMSMTIQVVQETPGSCAYRSKHFEFTTPVKLGANSMTEICRTFESTYELVSRLPWGINPWPEDGRIFRAQLFPTRQQYLATGAPEWSGGLYSSREKVFRIPFEEVGLKSRGNEFFLGGPVNNETITHEVTHQMMHDYLQFMPIWMIEGLAEYTAHLPYNSGRYSVSEALEGFKQMRRNAGKVKSRGVTVRAGSPPRWVGAEDLWGYTTSITERRPITSLAADPPTAPTTSSTTGSRPMRSVDPTAIPPEILGLPNRYFSAHALVFYFMHLDGDGKATRLKRYFDAIHEERKLWVNFSAAVAAYEVAFARYQAEIEAFRKLPGVVDLGNGTIRYPNNLQLPTPPPTPATPGNIDARKVCAKHLEILLGGRTPAQLDAEVRAAFTRVESAL